MKKSILNNIAQFILIVFSVVLGLYLSERIEERKNEKEAQLLLSKITAEVNDNKQLIAYWAPYHRQIAQRLDSLDNNARFVERFINDKSALFEEVLTRGNFMGRMPSSDAWDIAKAHPLIINFDYDELLILSKIYNQQQMTFEPVDKISETFFSPNFNAKENAKSNLQKIKSLMREIASREGQLMEFYNEAENVLNFQ